MSSALRMPFRVTSKAERASGILGPVHFPHSRRIAGVEHDCQLAETRNSLAEQFEPFAGDIRRLKRQSRDIAARASHRQAA